MNEHEFADLVRIEQDAPDLKFKVEPLPLRFKPSAPTDAAMLLERITRESAADVQKAEHSRRSLRAAEVLSRATNVPELERAASAFGGSGSIEGEMRKALRKAVAELPANDVGAIPNKRPITTPASRSPKSAARRAKLKQMFPEAGIDLSGYNATAIESLLDAMEAYLDSVLT